MVAPTPGAVGTQRTGSTSTPAFAAPAGVGAGKLVVIAFFCDGATTITGLPTGFSHAPGSPLYNNVNSHSLNVLYANNPAGSTYTVTLSASAYSEGGAVRYDGANVTSPWDTNSGTGAAIATRATSGTVTPAVSMTTQANDECVVHVTTDWSGGTWTPNTGFTKEIAANVGLVMLADAAQAAAGATGSITATCTGSDKQSAWLGALKPAAGGITGNLGEPSETDTAQPITRQKIKALGQPSETDVAQSTTRQKSRTLGQPSETDSAFTITRRKQKTLGLPIDTSVAQPVTRTKQRSLGQPSETDSGFAVGRKKSLTLGQPFETDSPLGYGHVISTAIGLPTETDSALPLTRQKRKALGIPAETDSALGTWGRKKQWSLGLPVEFDLPLALVLPNVVPVTPDIVIRTQLNVTTVTTGLNVLTVRTGLNETVTN